MLIQNLKPALSENVGGEKRFLFVDSYHSYEPVK